MIEQSGIVVLKKFAHANSSSQFWLPLPLPSTQPDNVALNQFALLRSAALKLAPPLPVDLPLLFPPLVALPAGWLGSPFQKYCPGTKCQLSYTPDTLPLTPPLRPLGPLDLATSVNPWRSVLPWRLFFLLLGMLVVSCFEGNEGSLFVNALSFGDGLLLLNFFESVLKLLVARCVGQWLARFGDVCQVLRYCVVVVLPLPRALLLGVLG